MIKNVFSGSVDYVQILDETGNADQSLFPKELDDKTLVQMYKSMSFARAADAKAISLQRQGRLATYGPMVGEEATQVGSAFAMRPQDIFVPNFRQHGVFMARGYPLYKFYLSWKGYEEGGAQKDFKSTAVAVPVGTQMPHGVGVAFAQKYKKTGAVVVAYVGDGGTSEGDFYEAINFAGAMKVPLVSIIENNQWAISMPRSRQSAAETLAQKGIAAGIKCVQVDGNDVIGVYKVVSEAIKDASDMNPSLIECVTYRMGIHTTSDDPTKYRPDSDVEEWKKKDPISRMRAYLSKNGMWDDHLEERMVQDDAKAIDDAVAQADAFKPDPKSMFENVYSFVPDVLKDEEEKAIHSNFWQ